MLRPRGKTRDELLSEEIAATVDPMQVHFKRLAETERRQKAAQPQNWWD
jgi:hypothetical protein